MLDPNQDRLMSRRMAYFRMKRRRLGETFERFLEESLEEGATLFIAECGLKWPTTRVGERHVFQFGALGVLRPKSSCAAASRWSGISSGEEPEAEWGFEPALGEDVERLARRRGKRRR